MAFRTCVVCRQRESKENLFRFVLAGAEQNFNNESKLNISDSILNEVLQKLTSTLRPQVVLDILQKAQKRAVYCHKNTECLGQEKTAKIIFAQMNKIKNKQVRRR